VKKKLSGKQLTNLFHEIGLLKKVQRTGWVLKGVKDVESVAEHTWRVAMLALVFAPQLNLDQLKLVKMALIHDLGEISIGDIKWESGKKVIGSQKQKHIDEREAIRKIFADNSSFEEYVELWEEFNNQKTREAKIVKQLDKLEMVIQALEYQGEGYPSEWFDEFWENAEKYLKGQELEPYFRFLKREREKI
jgi:putative hydrolase of HD superfamily